MTNYQGGYSPVDQNLNQQALLDRLLYESYPGINGISTGSSFHDEFNRATLNPTGGYGIYATAGTGTEDIATVISTGRTQLRLKTGATIADDASVRTSEYYFERAKGPDPTQEDRDKIRFDCLFNCFNAVSTKGFIGFILGTDAALTALPTTVAHMGIFWDTSSNTDYFLTSADGTDQTTTSSLLRAVTVWEATPLNDIIAALSPVH